MAMNRSGPPQLRRAVLAAIDYLMSNDSTDKVAERNKVTRSWLEHLIKGRHPEAIMSPPLRRQLKQATERRKRAQGIGRLLHSPTDGASDELIQFVLDIDRFRRIEGVPFPQASDYYRWIQQMGWTHG